MADPLYDRLADIFNLIGFGSHKSPELENLLKTLFNEEEARAAGHCPDRSVVVGRSISQPDGFCDAASGRPLRGAGQARQEPRWSVLEHLGQAVRCCPPG